MSSTLSNPISTPASSPVSTTRSNLEQRGLLFAALLLIAANVMTLFPGWFTVAGVLILGVLLPGTMAAAWLLRRALPSTSEFIAYSLGLGFTLYVLALLVVTDVPGPLHGWHVLLTLNLLSVALGIGWWRAQRTPALCLPEPPQDRRGLDRWAMVGLLSVLIVAALLRLPNLGYSDFQGDEARALLRASEAIQGYPSALVIHKKGPTEILIPLGIYAIQEQITEAQARFPFALAGIVGIFALYLLGWRMFGAVAGWLAAMLLAVDGYFIGFARIVQYQSVVFLMSVLVVLALYRQARADRPLPSYLLLAGLCMVGGIYAHYETIWVLIPALYLLYVYLRRTSDLKGWLQSAIVPLLVTAGLLMLFYVPFVLDAQWNETATYLFEHRIDSTSFPHNNTWDVFQRSAIYDSAYQLFFMILMTVVAQGVVLRKIWPRWAVWSVAALTLAGLAASLLYRHDWLIIGGTDHTWLFYTLAVAVAFVPPRITDEERTVWSWFGIAMVVSLFYVARPNTHVYGFFIPWALVVGLAGEAIWRGLRGITGLGRARLVALPVSVLLFAIFANYAFQIFTYTDVEVYRTWLTNRPWGYWTPYEIPNRGSLFGFPYKNGWKVIGALYADGTLDAPFDSNETYRMADWYSRGLHFCPSDAEYYMLPTTQQPDEALEDPAKLFELTSAGFRQWGVITVNGDERMRIFSKRPGDEPVRVFEESDYAPVFDATLTSPLFIKRGPALLAQPATTVEYRLQDHLWLKGYTLPRTQVAPGEQLELQLFWEVTQMFPRGDKSFIQLIDLDTLHKAAQRDGEPGCGVYHLGEWRTGELNLDPYTLKIAPDTPPGTYTLLVGMYDDETEERYPVFAADGAHLGDAIHLATVEVVVAK
ncbi:MAG: glycosyltransferase family 39 protein [Caldilineaceae bacterium]|nr:glycosyltransferase family 39 protein [Caldilineaceae bacterium]